MKRIALIAALVTLLPQVSLDAQAQVRRGMSAEPRPFAEPLVAPMQIVEGRPVVDVYVDGAGPFLFVVDTGASGTLVSTSVTSELGLTPVGRAMVGDPAGGEMRTVEVFSAGATEIGGVEIGGIRLVALEDVEFFEEIGVHGVLSPSVFAGNVMVFDFPEGELRVVPGELPDGDGVIPYATDMPFPNAELTIGSTTIMANIDTGNGRGAIGLPDAIEDQVPVSGSLTTGTARTVGGEFEIRRGELDGVARLGDVEFVRPSVFFQDRFDQANIGTAGLLEMTLMVDVSNRRFWLGRGTGPEPSGGEADTEETEILGAALDYIEGWFSGDSERIRRAVHPDLLKQIPESTGELGTMDAAILASMAERGGRREAPDLSSKVQLLTVAGDIAAVRIDAPDWVDLLHLMKTDEGWRILHVLWSTDAAGTR